MKKLTAVLLALVMTLGIASALADSFKPGDRVYFGHYEQDGNARNGAEKICWIVLKAEGDDLMLLSEKGLDRHRFHKSSDGTSWKGSELREWLNEVFLYAAFDASERDAIILTEVEDTLEHSNPAWNSGKRYGDVCQDMVFLPSYKEMNELVSDNDLYCTPSQYTLDKDVYTERHNGVRTCWYWLRTSAFRNNAAVVSADRQFDTCYIHHDYGVVRPAVCVDASAVTAY